MKLFNKFTFIFLCCLSISACSAGNILARMFLTQEQMQRQLNDKLINAARVGDLPAVQQALADGADIHVWDDYALRWAAESGHLPVVQFLLKHGADIHAADDMALRLAIEFAKWVVVVCLLQYGANRTILTAGQQQALRTSAQAHDYILTELRTALNNNDWSAVEQLLNIIPLQELPSETQENTRKLVVAAVAEQLIKIYKAQKNLPLNVQYQTLSHLVGPIAAHLFIQQRNQALAGNTHEII